MVSIRGGRIFRRITGLPGSGARVGGDGVAAEPESVTLIGTKVEVAAGDRLEPGSHFG